MKLKHFTSNLKRPVAAALATVATTATALAGNIVASASFSAYNGTSGTKIVNGVKNFVGTIGTWGGGMYAAVAIFTLILAIRNEDNEGRNKAILNLVAAIALLSTGTIIQLFFG